MNYDEFEKRQPHVFQFGIRTLFAATVVCAAIASLAATMNVPVIGRGLVAFLLIAYALYIILRVPGLLRRHRAVKEHFDKVHDDILMQAEDARKNSNNRQKGDAAQ